MGGCARLSVWLALALAVVWVGAHAQDLKYGDLVSVSAVGESEAQPDVARVIFSVNVQDPTHDKAREMGSEWASRVGQVLDDFRIPAKDIKTDHVRINPVHEWRERSARDTKPSRIIVAFEYKNRITVTLRDLERVSEITEAVIKQANGEISLLHVQYALEDREEQERLAREDAVRKARIYAEAMATAGGSRLGRVRSIVCHDQPYMYRNAPQMMMAESAAAMDDDGGPARGTAILGGGTEKVSVSASVVFELVSDSPFPASDGYATTPEHF